VGQAVPSVAPQEAARHFKKTECFCFVQQTLEAGEEKEMPLRFLVDADLPGHVNTITLSYSFFNADKFAPEAEENSDNGHTGPVTGSETSAVETDVEKGFSGMLDTNNVSQYDLRLSARGRTRGSIWRSMTPAHI